MIRGIMQGEKRVMRLFRRRIIADQQQSVSLFAIFIINNGRLRPREKENVHYYIQHCGYVK